MSSKAKLILKIVIPVGAVILIAAIVLACLYLFLPKSEPQYVAHMGYSKAYVGNTEAAFRAAAEMDFYGIETDIRKTKDGVYVCNHDEMVKYADGTQQGVAKHTFAELAAKPLKNGKTDEDVYLCTFKRYLEICKEGGKVAVIELKEDFDIVELVEMLAIVDAVYDREKISVISFYYDPLLRVKELDATVSLQYLSETKNDSYFDRCVKDGISADVRQSLLTSDLVKTFHAAGLTVNTWTVNKAFDKTIVRIKGADYVTTDLFDKN